MRWPALTAATRLWAFARKNFATPAASTAETLTTVVPPPAPLRIMPCRPELISDGRTISLACSMLS
jgi:hypothetical protein